MSYGLMVGHSKRWKALVAISPISRRKAGNRTGTLLIFDDAQASYKDMDLWGHFFKSIHEWNNRRAIAFSSYGTPSPRISVPGILIQWNKS